MTAKKTKGFLRVYFERLWIFRGKTAVPNALPATAQLASPATTAVLVAKVTVEFENVQTCLEKGRHGEALESCDRVLAIHPQYSEAQFIRGKLLMAMRRFEVALESLDRALVLQVF